MHHPTSHSTNSHSQATRLSLAKFSHTTTAIDHSGPLSWIHVNSNGDLACILENFSSCTSNTASLFLRVVRNDGILVFSSIFIVSISPVTDNELRCAIGATGSSSFCSKINSSRPIHPKCIAYKVVFRRCGQIALSCGEIPSQWDSCWYPSSLEAVLSLPGHATADDLTGPSVSDQILA